MAAAAVIQGQYGTGDGPSNERPFSHGDLLYKKNPEWAPLTALLMRMNRGAKLDDPRHFEYVITDLPRKTTLAEALDNSETGIDVAAGTGKYFRKWDVVKVTETGEQMLVTAIATDTLTVVRGWGSTAAAAAATGGPLLIVAHANPEGGSLPTAAAAKMEFDDNYSTILKVPISTTRTQMQTRTRPENRVGSIHPRNIELALREAQELIARTAYFGEKKEDLVSDPNGKPIRMAGGILDFVKNSTAGAQDGTAGANFIDLGGTAFDPDIFHGIAAKVQNVGTPGLRNKVCFIGPAVRRRLGEILTNAGFIRSDEERTKKYGFTVEVIKTNFGDLPLVTDHQLSGSGGPNITSGPTAFDAYGGYIFGICLEMLQLRFMQELILKRNVQNPGDDGTTDMYLAEFTLARAHPESHIVVAGING